MKTTGIILVVISVMAFIGWAGSYAQGKSGTESPIFYIFLLLLFIGGFALINKATNNKS